MWCSADDLPPTWRVQGINSSLKPRNANTTRSNLRWFLFSSNLQFWINLSHIRKAWQEADHINAVFAGRMQINQFLQ